MGLARPPRGDARLTRGDASAKADPPRGDGSAMPSGPPLAEPLHTVNQVCELFLECF